MKYLCLFLLATAGSCNVMEEKVVKEVEVVAEKTIEDVVEEVIFEETGIKVEFPEPGQNTVTEEKLQEKSAI